MADYLIRGGLFLRDKELLENSGLFITGKKITLLRPDAGLPAPREVIDATGYLIVPGFIDLHVHGGGGADALDGSVEAIYRMAAFHARHGTTGLLPAIAAAPLRQLIDSLQAIGDATSRLTNGARILGAHLEGPFLNPARKGAQNKDYLLMPGLSTIKTLAEAAGGRLRMVTLAPELPGCGKVIEWLAAAGIIPAAGHTEATFEQMMEAVKAGLKHVTHIFNGMTPFHHRQPGPAGAALACSLLSVEVIADGIHVHPAVLRLLQQLKGEGRLALVTDAISAAGTVSGTCCFAGQAVTIQNGRAGLPDGTLAGSTLTMLQGVKNLVRLSGMSIPQAIRLASTNPAIILGLQHCKGRVAQGYDADLLILDQNFELKMVMVEGKIVYKG